MAIESRGKRTYYYRKERRGDKVVGVYLGKADSLLGNLAARLAEALKDVAAAERARRAEDDELDRTVKALAGEVRAIANGVLEAAGYHQHRRGSWRKRRMAGVDTHGPGMFPKGSAEREAFLARSYQGDESTRPAWANFVLSYPHTADAYNLVRDTQEMLILRYAGKQIAAQEAMKANVKAMRDELAGPDPSPIERHLVDRVVTCWLAAYVADREAMGNGNAATVRHAERRCAGAHNRYVSSLKALALVRRLALPAIKLNLDQRRQTVQVNQAEPKRIEAGDSTNSTP